MNAHLLAGSGGQLAGFAPITRAEVAAAAGQGGAGAKVVKVTVPNTQKMTRTLHVRIRGSLANFDQFGENAASWGFSDSQQITAFGPDGNSEALAVTNQLRTAMITGVKVVQDSSSFPVPIGIRINCVPSTEITCTGEKFAYTVLPKSSNSNERVIYQSEPESENGVKWRNDFPQWNATNLEKEGVMEVNERPWVFVHQDHPIISLLEYNPELIGCQIEEQPKVDAEWYKVSRQVLTACCKTLREKVLKHVTSHDLNMFRVQAKRIDASSWADMTDLAGVLQSADPLDSEAVTKFLATPYTYTARIQIEYELQMVG